MKQKILDTEPKSHRRQSEPMKRVERNRGVMQQMRIHDFYTQFPQKNACCGKLVHKFVEKFMPEPLDRILLAVVYCDCENENNIAPCYDVVVGLPGCRIIGAREPYSVFLNPFPLDGEGVAPMLTQLVARSLTTIAQHTYTNHA